MPFFFESDPDPNLDFVKKKQKSTGFIPANTRFAKQFAENSQFLRRYK